MWTGTREDGKDGKQELRPTKPDVGQAPAAGTMCGIKRVAPEKAALKMFARRPPDINAGKPPAGGGRAACVFYCSPADEGAPHRINPQLLLNPRSADYSAVNLLASKRFYLGIPNFYTTISTRKTRFAERPGLRPRRRMRNAYRTKHMLLRKKRGASGECAGSALRLRVQHFIFKTASDLLAPSKCDRALVLRPRRDAQGNAVQGQSVSRRRKYRPPE